MFLSYSGLKISRKKHRIVLKQVIKSSKNLPKDKQSLSKKVLQTEKPVNTHVLIPAKFKVLAYLISLKPNLNAFKDKNKFKTPRVK